MPETTTISTYLLQHLHELKLTHLFGVPGDYVLDFLDQLIESPLAWVGTCNELDACEGLQRLGAATRKG